MFIFTVLIRAFIETVKACCGRNTEQNFRGGPDVHPIGINELFPIPEYRFCLYLKPHSITTGWIIEYNRIRMITQVIWIRTGRRPAMYQENIAAFCSRIVGELAFQADIQG